MLSFLSNSLIYFEEFASVLEQLETEFYAQALQTFLASDFTAAGFTSAQVPIEQLTIIGADEATHSDALAVSNSTPSGAGPYSSSTATGSHSGTRRPAHLSMQI